MKCSPESSAEVVLIGALLAAATVAAAAADMAELEERDTLTPESFITMAKVNSIETEVPEQPAK